MPTTVKEQNVRSIQTAAQVRDFYTRPAVNQGNRLEQIAAAYRGFSSNLNQWLDKERKQREDIEIAQGQELYRRRLEYGEEFNAEEMAEKAKNGDYEGFKNLTKFQKEGIRRMRHEIFGAKLQEHMLAWAGNATITDGNGNQVPLSMAEDTDAVINAFYKESTRYAQEKTGGQYDPRLAQEFIRTAERNAFNQFINNQAAARNTQIRLEQQAVVTEMMDMLFPNLINSGNFLTDPEGSKALFDSIISRAAVMCMENGITESDTKAFVGQYMQFLLRNTRDDDAIDFIHDLAQQHILFQDPAVREEITAAAEQGHQANTYRRRREEIVKKEEARSLTWDLLRRSREGEDVSQELSQLYLSSPEAAQVYVDMNKLYQAVFDASKAMPYEEYDWERILFMRGAKGFGELAKMFPRLNDAQRDELWGYVSAYETKLRQWKSDMEKQGKIVTEKQYREKLEKDFKAMNDVVKRVTKTEGEMFPSVGTYELTASQITLAALMDFNDWAEEYPKLAADPARAARKRAEIVNNLAPQYMANAYSYTENPDLVFENPREVRYDDARANVSGAFSAMKTNEIKLQLRDALEKGNEAVIQRILKKHSVAKDKLVAGARKLISDFRYVEEEEQRRKLAQEGGGV